MLTSSPGADLEVDILEHRQAAERPREVRDLEKRRRLSTARAVAAATATRGLRASIAERKSVAEARRASPARPSGRRMMMTTKAAPRTSCQMNGKSPERLALR